MGVYRVGLAAVLFLVGLGVAKVVTSILVITLFSLLVLDFFVASRTSCLGRQVRYFARSTRKAVGIELAAAREAPRSSSLNLGNGAPVAQV